MNRYRTIPALGQPKASTTTTCQKCLKKDSYECKSTLQERPYISRPSRSQQFLNPKLKPKLASDTANSLMRNQGVADEELARAQAARESASNMDDSTRRSQSPGLNAPATKRQRSVSASSYDSVSTISTSRSRSPQPRRRMSPDANHGRGSGSRSRSLSRPRKRKDRDSSFSRSPPRFKSSNKARRYRSDSPDDRGRPTDNRRGSNRSRSRDASSNRSQITKQRRSLEQVDAVNGRGRDNSSRHFENRGARLPPSSRRERSLSPYSRRLALTQAMNMSR